VDTGSTERPHRKAVLILSWAPAALALTEYLFIPPRSVAAFPWLTDGDWEYRRHLAVYLWWAGGTFTLWVLMPALLLGAATGTRLGELGLRVIGKWSQLPKYAALYALMTPLIFLASRQPEFQANYPFYRPAEGFGSASFALFQLAYFAQFFAVEFFFRGVLVLGLKPAIGRLSVLVALTPYCMIHFHKPLPEALGSIVAGLVLGTLAWRTETVIFGWLLHYAVAISLDLAAIWA
jgi:uncharacterized protein